MRLYKYRPMGTADSFHRHALEEIIGTGKLWFSRPSNFEDKLDCRPAVEVANPALLRRWLVKNGKVPAINPLKPTSKEVSAFMIKHKDYAWLEKRWFDVTDNITGVCCLSSNYQLDYQWDNYGDAHQGVCIEIETDDHTGGIKPRPVVYDDSRPQVFIDQFISDEPYRLSKTYEVLTQKAKEFSDEEEYRILICQDSMPEHGLNLRFDDHAFKRIILGREISNEHADVTRFLAESSPIGWEVVQA